MTPPALGAWAASCREWDIITPPSLGYFLIDKTVQEMTACPSSTNLAMAPLPWTQHVSHTLASLDPDRQSIPPTLWLTQLHDRRKPRPPQSSNSQQGEFLILQSSPQTQCHLLREDFPHLYLPKLVSTSSHIQLFNLC